jgi:hypothetical protein
MIMMTYYHIRDVVIKKELTLHRKLLEKSHSLRIYLFQCCRAGAARSGNILEEPGVQRDAAPVPTTPVSNSMLYMDRFGKNVTNCIRFKLFSIHIGNNCNHR